MATAYFLLLCINSKRVRGDSNPFCDYRYSVKQSPGWLQRATPHQKRRDDFCRRRR